MKRILRINHHHKMCIIEPGVSYDELQKALAKEGLILSTAIAPRASKSVIASIHEAESRLKAMNQWAFFDPLRCLDTI